MWRGKWYRRGWAQSSSLVQSSAEVQVGDLERADSSLHRTIFIKSTFHYRPGTFSSKPHAGNCGHVATGQLFRCSSECLVKGRTMCPNLSIINGKADTVITEITIVWLPRAYLIRMETSISLEALRILSHQEKGLSSFKFCFHLRFGLQIQYKVSPITEGSSKGQDTISS